MKKLIFKKHLNYKFIKRMIGWHVRYYLFGRGTPLSAGVYINDVCNYRCAMCDIRMSKEPIIYPREAQERDIDSLARMGVVYYSISGGEPTLVRDLPERLAYAVKKIPYVHVVTNGSTMTKDLACKLADTGIQEISVSIDGTEEFNNKLRGIPNAFAKAWNALALLREHAPEVDIVVNSILTPYNLNSLRDLSKRIDCTYPGVHLKYLPLTFHELFLTAERDSLPLDEKPAPLSEIKSFIESALADPKVVNSPIFLHRAILYFSGQQDVLPEQKRCLYPYYSIQFDSRGAAYPCLTGTCKNDGRNDGEDLEEYVSSERFRQTQKKLEECEKCRGSMMLCYYEPRLNFPLHTFLLGKFVS